MVALEAGACAAAGGTCTTELFCLQPWAARLRSDRLLLLRSICAPDGSLPLIEASNYDQSCTTDSDCIAIAEGDVCTPCGIGCTNAAINVAAHARYKADVASANAVAATYAWRAISMRDHVPPLAQTLLRERAVPR